MMVLREMNSDRTSASQYPRQHFVFPDGRRLYYRVFGDAGGVPVLALHGTPGSSLKFATAAYSAQRRGLLFISLDRWGYGGSEPPPRPHLAGYANDVAAFMSALGHERFAVLGVSGGGPFAVAVAACLATRVMALALVAPVGEIAKVPVGWAADERGMNLFHAFCFHTLARSPAVVRGVFRAFRSLLKLAPTFAIRVATARSSPDDRRIMAAPAASEHLSETFKDGMAGSVSGPSLDLALFRTPWEFQVSDVMCSACIWVGTADSNVPLAAIYQLARDLTDARLEVLPDAGHYWIVAHMADVVDWLEATVGASAVAGTTAVAPTNENAGT